MWASLDTYSLELGLSVKNTGIQDTVVIGPNTEASRQKIWFLRDIIE